MRNQFQTILSQLQQGQSACLELTTPKGSYYRSFQPRERLILLGGGHIAAHVCQLAAWLGFSVTVVDDRPMFASHDRFPDAEEVLCDDFIHAIRALCIRDSDYVAVMTRGHRFDTDCLHAILSGTLPGYLGLIASRRRGIALMKVLEEEGYPREALDSIHTPIGLDINAMTLEEIAVSIAAQLVQHRRKDTPRRSQSEQLTQTDINWELLGYLAEDATPKALLVVCRTSGSTPVKSGAMMAVNRLRHCVGTIGGGCGEAEVAAEAAKLIGTGGSGFYTVSLNADLAAEEGMVCGGEMEVWMTEV